MEKFWEENVRSTSTLITSGWIESTESHVILGGGVAVACLFTFVGASRGHLCDSTACSFRRYSHTSRRTAGYHRYIQPYKYTCLQN